MGSGLLGTCVFLLQPGESEYSVQVVVVYEQTDAVGNRTMQLFMAQCVHQKILYNKQTIPRRIEEALEE
jgi:hypothetical protein